MRGQLPKEKSRLSAQSKSVVAAHAVLDTVEGLVDEKTVGRKLREEVGLQWSFLTCLQYLSGQEAIAALEALPNDWSDSRRTKLQLQAAAILAAHTVANVRSDGTMLCASHLAGELKGKTVEHWLAAKSNADRVGV